MRKLPLSFFDFLGPRLGKCFSFCLWEADTGRISWEVNYIQEFHNFQRQSLKMVKWLGLIYKDTEIKLGLISQLTFPLFFQIWLNSQGVTDRGIDSDPKWFLTVYLNFHEKLSDILILLNSKETELSLIHI